MFFFFSSRRRHTRCYRDWSSDVCSSDLIDDRPELLLPLHDRGHGSTGVMDAPGDPSIVELVEPVRRRDEDARHLPMLSPRRGEHRWAHQAGRREATRESGPDGALGPDRWGVVALVRSRSRRQKDVGARAQRQGLQGVSNRSKVFRMALRFAELAWGQNLDIESLYSTWNTALLALAK